MFVFKSLCVVLFTVCQIVIFTEVSAQKQDNDADCDRSRFFKCAESDKCIPRDKLCDGVVDCPDTSDETIRCREFITRCPSYAFRCDYGACIDGKGRCNRVQDCADNSDERAEMCYNTTKESESPPISVCGKDDFVCDDGFCIEMFKVCDGIKHCKDGSDETRQVCSTKKCPYSSFKCDYGACVHVQAKCNGIVDCADESDERLPECRRTTSRFGPTQPPKWSTYYKCMLPAPPKNGRYSITSMERQKAGNFVEEGTYISYSCNNNYVLIPNTKHFICLEGEWMPNKRPMCVGQESPKRKPSWWVFYR